MILLVKTGTSDSFFVLLFQLHMKANSKNDDQHCVHAAFDEDVFEP
jgi:hypothetical protein